MSTRKLIIIAVPAAAVLILALIGVLGDGESVADPDSAAGVVTKSRSAEVLPFTPSASMLLDAGGQAVPFVFDEAPASGEEALDASLVGRVSGTLVDLAGQPIPGEPVFLLGDRDAWADPGVYTGERDAVERLLGRALSGPDGRFEFPARAGRRHEVLAGGGKWSMQSVERVSSGDDVRVTMRDGLMLTGQVFDAERGLPMADAYVLAAAEDNVLLGKTGLDGTFSLGPLPAEVGIVGSWSPGFNSHARFNVAPALGPLDMELGPGIEVSGLVSSRETKEPLTGGTITSLIDVEARMLGTDAGLPEHLLVEERSVELAEDGSFTLPEMPERGFSLIAKVPGFVPYRYTRYLIRDYSEGTTIKLRLTPLRPLTGTVTAAEDEQPVPGCQLVAYGALGVLGTASTGEEGEFELALDAWDGQPPLRIEAFDDRGRTARNIIDTRKYNKPIQLVLRKPFRVDALVLQSGLPVVGAEVALLGDDERISVGRTGLDGMVELVHAPGAADLSDLYLQARYLDMQSLPVEIDLAELPEEPVDLELTMGGWLVGQVVDPFGIPVPSARLDVTETAQKGYGMRDASVRSRDDGTFRIGPVRAEVSLKLVVNAEGFDRRTLKDVMVGTGEMLVRLEPVVEWEGRVVSSATGQPLSSYSVRLMKYTEGAKQPYKTAKARVKIKVDEPGSFSVPMPEPGVYAIRVTASNHQTTYSDVFVFDGLAQPPYANLLVWPAAVLEVTVADAIGRPVEGYYVLVLPWELAADAELPEGKLRKQGSKSRTNSSGRVSFNLGAGGGFRVAGGPGVWFESSMLVVTPGPPLARLYHLPPTADVEVTVLDEAGAPLSDLVVYMRTHKAETEHSIFRRASLRRGENIAFFEALPQARYEIEVRRRKYVTQKRELTLQGHGIDHVTVQLQLREPTVTSSDSAILLQLKGR
jgi:hypothetical protein